MSVSLLELHASCKTPLKPRCTSLAFPVPRPTGNHAAAADPARRERRQRRGPELREKDFGSLEGVSFRGERPACDDAETAQSVRERAACFLDENLVPLLAADVAQETESVCAVVAHGILLSALAHVLFSRFAPGNIVLPAGPERNGLALDGPAPVLPSWSNTGYLEVVISAPSGALSDDIDWLRRRLCVERVNCTVHLQNLKKTRGGIGSAPFDERQRTMNHFFPRQPKPPQ
ncbi:hypothetical protein HIM_08673 [Hirsutella minnesotensis 3608]|uniref:Uncharacterized protein n=1 Tax=Hirsutella minnesotensis 3608 TaxID=1043627 RepID=A0A0F7ZY62_9HYPO|nr:hypothetical protein HIM_08673 [Hirsutella minnesotensis 3608]